MLVISILCLVNLLWCSTVEANHSPSLSFWNDGNTKQVIIDFVQDVTEPESDNFVKPSDRIAIFDNDGTLWTEKPCSVEAAFFAHRLQQKSASISESVNSVNCLSDYLQTNPLSKQEIYLKYLGINSGLTTDEYQAMTLNFVKTKLHPDFGVPYIQLTYQPMVQLLEYLRENDFQIYICSGAELEYMRSFVEEIYQVPPPNVIGTSFLTKFATGKNQEPVLIRLDTKVFPDNNYEGKVVGIERYIGKKPIMTVGNSDGDLAMLQYTDDGQGKHLMMLVNHDDAEREFDYKEGAENAYRQAQENGWTLISVKHDFKEVFAVETKH